MFRGLALVFILSVSNTFAGGISVKGRVLSVGQCHIKIKQSKNKKAFAILKKYAPQNIKRGQKTIIKLSSARDFHEARVGGEFFARKLAMPGGTGISRKLPGGTGISNCDLNGSKFMSLDHHQSSPSDRLVSLKN